MARRRIRAKAIDRGDNIGQLMIVLGIVLFLTLVANLLTGCSSESAKAQSGCTANNFSANDGARCYVIYCDGKAVAGNCN